MNHLNKAKSHIENWLSQYGWSTAQLSYIRASSVCPLSLWLQQQMDPVGIESFNIELDNGRIRYNELIVCDYGKFDIPFILNYGGRIKSPFAIESATFHVPKSVGS